jgi:hypothetical protein
MLRTRVDTGSYPKRIADAEWIFSRGEALLLATTATTSEMPGGMMRLIHRNEYTQVSRKVKNSCQFSVIRLALGLRANYTIKRSSDFRKCRCIFV